MDIKSDSLPFKITPSRVIYPNGVTLPASPEVYLMAAVYQRLGELIEVMKETNKPTLALSTLPVPPAKQHSAKSHKSQQTEGSGE